MIKDFLSGVLGRLVAWLLGLLISSYPRTFWGILVFNIGVLGLYRKEKVNYIGVSRKETLCLVITWMRLLAVTLRYIQPGVGRKRANILN